MLLEAYIEQSWDSLSCEADLPPHDPAVIPLPFPYVVTGVEAGEVRYWDSYSIILGLLSSGRHRLAKDMLSNFAHLIDTYGYIPTGSRSNHLLCSHPPVFSLMVNEVARYTRDTDVYVEYAPHVLKEYLFWMRGAEVLNGKPGASERVVILGPNAILNRYWGGAQGADETQAAIESGWESSSRWLDHDEDGRATCVTNFLPVDLNCLMWATENFLALSYEGMGQEAMSKSFHRLKDRRKDSILNHCWDPVSGIYSDYNWVRGKSSDTRSLAMLFPLFVGIATKKHATVIAKHMSDFIKPGGLVTTLSNTGMTWDAPYGSAPLQWVGYAAMQNYGFTDLAESVANNWVSTVRVLYERTGELYRHYNVEDFADNSSSGGGFGWTNGVLMRFLELHARIKK